MAVFPDPGLSCRGIEDYEDRSHDAEQHCYFVDAGSVGLKLAGVSGTFRLRWIDVAKGRYTGAEQTLTAGGTVTNTTPGSTTGGWAAVITRRTSHRLPAPPDK